MKIAILQGKRSAPACGVADHSVQLAEALNQRNDVILIDVDWSELGWLRAMFALHKQYRSNSRDWAVLQFTPLGWSDHGFPFGALVVAIVTRLSGVKLATIMHDPIAFTGTRLRDVLRRHTQQVVMRGLVRCVHVSFVTLEPGKLPWADNRLRSRLIQLPVGSNFPSPVNHTLGVERSAFTVLVFGISKGQEVREAEEIATIMKAVSSEVNGTRLVVMGNGSQSVGALFGQLLADANIDVTTTGVIAAERIGQWLCNGDAFLFVRGVVSARRGTVIAAISHSLPIVGYQGSETGWPVTEAGVALAPRGNWMELATALIRLAKDSTWRESSRLLSRKAFEQYFNWDGIAHRMELELGRGR